MVLTSDNCLRLYHLSDLSMAEQTFHLQVNGPGAAGAATRLLLVGIGRSCSSWAGRGARAPMLLRNPVSAPSVGSARAGWEGGAEACMCARSSCPGAAPLG